MTPGPRSPAPSSGERDKLLLPSVGHLHVPHVSRTERFREAPQTYFSMFLPPVLGGPNPSPWAPGPSHSGPPHNSLQSPSWLLGQQERFQWFWPVQERSVESVSRADRDRASTPSASVGHVLNGSAPVIVPPPLPGRGLAPLGLIQVASNL